MPMRAPRGTSGAAWRRYDQDRARMPATASRRRPDIPGLPPAVPSAELPVATGNDGSEGSEGAGARPGAELDGAALDRETSACVEAVTAVARVARAPAGHADCVIEICADGRTRVATRVTEEENRMDCTDRCERLLTVWEPVRA